MKFIELTEKNSGAKISILTSSIVSCEEKTYGALIWLTIGNNYAVKEDYFEVQKLIYNA